MFKASGSSVEQRPVVRLLFATLTIQFKRTLRMQPPLGTGDTSSSESVERRLYSQATLNVLGLPYNIQNRDRCSSSLLSVFK